MAREFVGYPPWKEKFRQILEQSHLTIEMPMEVIFIETRNTPHMH